MIATGGPPGNPAGPVFIELTPAGPGGSYTIPGNPPILSAEGRPACHPPARP